MTNIQKTYQRLQPFIKNIPLQLSEPLSHKYSANIYFKREDLQNTRSFKIRGSLNKIIKEYQKNPKLEVVCASAGNHAQGVAFACHLLNIQGNIFVPNIIPPQKQNRIKYFGQDNINLILEGNTFNETLEKSLEFSLTKNYTFIHPYDDYDIIEGQSTIGYEINKELVPDYVICPIGGGGLISGLYQSIPKSSQIIGCEPEGADSMLYALQNNKPLTLPKLDNFVDGASVGKVGQKTFEICRDIFSDLNNIKVVSTNHVCHEMINMYQEEGIILEPAAALSICALDKLELETIKNKNVVCILSGGNNDVLRYPEIMEKNLIYLNRKHYYIIEFTQKPKQLKKFISNVLTTEDDITRFEYIKKTNKSFGNVLIGLETNNHQLIEEKLSQNNFKFQKIKDTDLIYSYLI